MAPRAAADVLRRALVDPRAPFTVADASSRSGLALRDAEQGLKWLTSEYRGHLRVTSEGELLYLFPSGFTKPWETQDRLARLASRAASTAAGVGRFVVRAWITIVLVAYAAIFLAMAIGLAVGNRSSSSHRSGGVIGYVLFRALGDALFWTFHPFSPISVNAAYVQDPRIRRRRRVEKDGVPFYERVNRFFFGPAPAPEDPRAVERRVLAAIRAQQGRIGLADVMRVTGLPRDQADPMMARLMLDYEGDVSVSEDGGITYRFEALRKTAEERPAEASPPPPAWEARKPLEPLTGNRPGTNFGIAALNAFNVFMGLIALDTNMTLHRFVHLFDRIPKPIPYDGVPIALGLVPFVFSVALFALPVLRGLARPLKARKVAAENGRLAVLREVLTSVDKREPLTETRVNAAWAKGAGRPADPKVVTREVVALGGDVDIGEAGEVRYRFADLETERAALEVEREAAKEGEKKVGRVVFASDN
jgi:hypothetical protein